MSDERYTLFLYGPFSQWQEADFILDEIEYGCAEQYMMAEKARLFGDVYALELILDSDDPAHQKQVGRQIENFSVSEWEDDDNESGRPHCWLVVWRGNMAKFAQNPFLRDQLLATAGTTPVEASPADTIRGIGLTERDPGCRDRSTWRGRNWLGEVLTHVRETLARDATPYERSDDPRQPL